jgi:hypothetical protein
MSEFESGTLHEIADCITSRCFDFSPTGPAQETAGPSRQELSNRIEKLESEVNELAQVVKPSQSRLPGCGAGHGVEQFRRVILDNAGNSSHPCGDDDGVHAGRRTEVSPAALPSSGVSPAPPAQQSVVGAEVA